MPETDINDDDPARSAGPLGRILRISGGVLLLAGIAGFYLNGTGRFALFSAAVAMALAAAYILLHRVVSTRRRGLGVCVGALLALAPIVLVFVLGTGGGWIFGAGEGQLGALTFLGVSLVLAGLRGDGGCEVMALPNALAKKDAHLACLVFSPIDRLERRLSGRRRVT